MILLSEEMTEQDFIANLMEARENGINYARVAALMAPINRIPVGAYINKCADYYRNNGFAPRQEDVRTLHLSLTDNLPLDNITYNRIRQIIDIPISLVLPYENTATYAGASKDMICIYLRHTSDLGDICSLCESTLTANHITYKSVAFKPHVTIIKNVNEDPPQEIRSNPGFDNMKFNKMFILG